MYRMRYVAPWQVPKNISQSKGSYTYLNKFIRSLHIFYSKPDAKQKNQHYNLLFADHNTGFLVLTIKHNYLNFAEPCSRVKQGTANKQDTGPTSRTIIRAAWLRLLPEVHLPSIYQVFCLGS